MSRDITSSKEALAPAAATSEAGAAGGAGASATRAASPTEAPAHIIPNRIHFIWLGHSELPVRYLWNILNCHELNADSYSINLWVNPEYFSKPEEKKYQRFNFLKRNGISLRNYNDLFVKPLDKGQSTILSSIDKTHLSRPVVASDILRIMILAHKNEGGFYFDTDTIFKKALPVSLNCLPGTSLIIDETIRGYLIETKDHYLLNNSFMASVPGGREIKELMKMLIINLNSLISYGDGMMEAMSSEMIVRYTGLQLFASLCRTSRPDGTATHCQRDFSRLLYAKLRHCKAHIYDNTWMEHPPLARNRHHDWLASVALFMRAKGKLKSEKLIEHTSTGACDEMADSKALERPTSCWCHFIKK